MIFWVKILIELVGLTEYNVIKKKVRKQIKQNQIKTNKPILQL